MDAIALSWCSSGRIRSMSMRYSYGVKRKRNIYQLTTKCRSVVKGEKKNIFVLLWSIWNLSSHKLISCSCLNVTDCHPFVLSWKLGMQSSFQSLCLRSLCRTSAPQTKLEVNYEAQIMFCLFFQFPPVTSGLSPAVIGSWYPPFSKKFFYIFLCTTVWHFCADKTNMYDCIWMI